MIPYLFILFLTILIFVSHSVNNEKQNRITALLWVVMMSVFVGLQDGIGQDYLTYRNWAQMADTADRFHDISATVIVLTVNFLHLPDVSIFFIYAFIAYLFITLFLLEFPKAYRVVGVLLLFPNVYFFQSFNIIRQIAAASVFVYGAQLLVNGNKKAYLILIFPPLIHLTAILSIILLFLVKYVKLNLSLAVVYIISIFIFLYGGVMQHLTSLVAMLALYDDHYEYLAYGEINPYAGLGLQYILTLFYGFMLYFRRRTALLSVYQKPVVFAFLGLIMYNLLASEVTFFRMSFYFYFYIFAVVPLIVMGFDKRCRNIVACSLSLIYIIQFIMMISLNKSFIPYKSVLF